MLRGVSLLLARHERALLLLGDVRIHQLGHQCTRACLLLLHCARVLRLQRCEPGRHRLTVATAARLAGLAPLWRLELVEAALLARKLGLLLFCQLTRLLLPLQLGHPFTARLGLAEGLEPRLRV